MQSDTTPEEQRAVLDELNRQLREATSRRERAESSGGRQQVNAEVRTLITQAEDRVEDDRVTYAWSMLAAQGPELLERVAAARSLDEGLTRTLEQERHARGAAPTVEITRPADNDSFDPGESVLLSAEAAACLPGERHLPPPQGHRSGSLVAGCVVNHQRAGGASADARSFRRH